FKNTPVPMMDPTTIAKDSLKPSCRCKSTFVISPSSFDRSEMQPKGIDRAGKSDANADAATAKPRPQSPKTDAFAVQTANHHEVRECACRAGGIWHARLHAGGGLLPCCAQRI